jgi:hypothetical protein
MGTTCACNNMKRHDMGALSSPAESGFSHPEFYFMTVPYVENIKLNSTNGIYGHDCLALSGRRYIYHSVPRATALCAFALVCYASAFQAGGYRRLLTRRPRSHV